MPEITKIVLTGGPRAGKTTAKAHLFEFICSNPGLNCDVLFVSETAQDFIDSGFRPGDNISRFDFQMLIMKHQLAKEQLYIENAKKMQSEKVIIVFDRGVLDGKAYVSDEEFNLICAESGLSKDGILDRYDLIIHLETAAKSNPDIYSKYRDGRSENADDSIEIDEKLKKVWSAYGGRQKIISDKDFEVKMSNVVNTVCSHLNMPMSLKLREKIIQKKYLIDCPNISVLEGLSSVKKITILNTYLEVSEDKEVRIRAIGNNGKYEFIKTTKIIPDKNNPLSRIVSKEILNEKKYITLFADGLSSSYKTTKKTRYMFEYDGRDFSVDLYSIPNRTGTAILETNVDKSDDNPNIPDWINIYEEVTNNISYKDSSLARENAWTNEIINDTFAQSKQIFISYKSEDSKYANSIVQFLREHGYDCWIAPQSIPGGQDYTSSIPKAIIDSDAFVFLVSAKSQESEWCQDEVQLAKSNQKIIIPIKIDDKELNQKISFSLIRCQMIDGLKELNEVTKELIIALDATN